MPCQKLVKVTVLPFCAAIFINLKHNAKRKRYGGTFLTHRRIEDRPAE
jgi:hypothetical protein